MLETSRRMEAMTSHFFAAHGAKVAAMQSAGVDVIRLDVGSPDMPPAPHIVAALSRSAGEPGTHGYQPHSGTRDLRAAWAEMYRKVHGVTLDPEREVVPLLGSKEGIFHLSMAYVDPGDLVLVPDPGYITYSRGAQFAGGKPYTMRLLPERGYLPDFGSIPAEIARKAKLLWLNYPNNPTAGVASAAFFSEAVAFARQFDLLLCHDAAYTQVTFDGYRAPSVLEVPGAKEVAVEFNTLSKSHNMAGWRVAAAVGNPQALKALYTLKTNLDSSHFLPVFEAATIAMTGDQSWQNERNEIYRQRRDVVVPALRQMGLAAANPQASLYVWSSIPAGWTAVDFVTELLEKAHVSLTPGTVFGAGGEGHVRLSLTDSKERLAEAMQRMASLDNLWGSQAAVKTPLVSYPG